MNDKKLTLPNVHSTGLMTYWTVLIAMMELAQRKQIEQINAQSRFLDQKRGPPPLQKKLHTHHLNMGR